MRKEFGIFLALALFLIFSPKVSIAAAPVISGVAVRDVASASARVEWTTDTPAHSTVMYGLTASYSQHQTDSTNFVTFHSILLSGLTSGTTYHFSVMSCTSSGACPSAQEPDRTFTTLSSNSGSGGGGGGGAPAAPMGVGAGQPNTSIPSVVVGWDKISDATHYNVHRSVNSAAYTFVSQTGASGDASVNYVNYTDTNVTVGSTVRYKVEACKSGYGCSSPTESANTVAVAGSTGGGAPAAPGGVSAHQPTANVSSVLVYWDVVSDATHYNIHRSVNSGSYSYVIQVNQGTGASVNYTDTNVATGLNYRYKVEACKSGYGCSNPTESGTVPVTGDTVPAAPSGLTAALTGNGADVNLSWTDNSNNESKFKIYRKLMPSGSLEYRSMVGSNVTTALDSSLSAGTYEYSVSACNSSDSCSQYSNSATVTVTGSTATTIPLAPSSLFASGSSATYIGLYWADNSTDETEFRIERRFNGGVWSQVGSVSGNTTTKATTNVNTFYTDNALIGAGTYEYRVKACNSAGCSSESNTMSRTIDAAAPAAPSGLTATYSSTAGSVTVSWIDNSNNEWGFRLKRRAQGSVSWLGLASIAANYTTFTDTYQLAANTTYDYVVRSYNTYESADSNIVTVTTGGTTSGDPTPPSVPTNVAATAMSSSSVRISWAAATDNVGISVYRIYRGGAEIGWVLASVLFYTNTGLSPGTSYSYTVAAQDTSNNLSTQSSPVSAATLSSGATSDTTAPSTPTGLAATAYSSSQINLSWNASTDNVGVTAYQVFKNGLFLHQTASLSFSDTGLLPGTTYSYYVRALDAASYTSPNSAVVSAATLSSSGTTTTTAGGVPSVPSNLRFESPAGTPTAFLIKWTDTAANEDKFNVERKTAGTGNWVFLTQIVGANIQTYTDFAVTSGTYYDYRVQACQSGYGCSDYAYLYNVTSGGEVPASGGDTSSPSAPTGVSATVHSSSRINLSWAASTDNAGVAAYWVYRNGSLLTSTVGLNYEDTAVSPGTYSYHVKAKDAAGNVSPLSNTATVTIAAATATTTPPTDTTATTTAPMPTIDLKVDGAYGTVSRVAPAAYTLTWTTTGGTTVCVPGGTWANSGNKPAPSGSWNFIGVTVLGLKTYTLTCSNGAGSASATVYVDIVPFSTATSTATSTFPLPPPPTPTSTAVSTTPSAPSQFTATLMPTTGEVNFSWLDNSSNESRFELYYRLPGGLMWNYLSTISQNLTTFMYPNHPFGTYEYQVRACNAYGCSESNFASLTKSNVIAAVQNAALHGVVTDENDRPLSQAWLHVYSPDFLRNFDGASDNQGNFRITLPQGSYAIEAFPPYGRDDLIRPEPRSFTVGAGETKKADMKFHTRVSVNKIIGGRITFSNGAAVTDAEVGAYNYRSGGWLSTSTDGGGNFVLRVGPGRWKVGFGPRSPASAVWRFTNEFREVEFKDDILPETRTINFTVPVAGARLTVKTVDDQGNVLAGAGVILDTFNSQLAHPAETQVSPEFRKTDSNGLAAFHAPAGRYFIRAFLPPERDFINPGETAVDVTSAEEKTVTLTFKRKSVFAGALIRGVAKLDDGRPTAAFIWGWSEEGGFNNVRASEGGEFSFPVALGTRWHIGAGKELNTIPYKASEVVVEVKSQVVSVEIVLTKAGTAPLPPSVEVVKEANQTARVQTQDGAAITLPPASAAASGKVEIEIKPTVEAPSQQAAKVVGTVYDVSVKDQSGSTVTALRDEVEITLPYDEAELQKQGITENSLIPSYFDESAGVWVKIDNYTIDKEKNVVIARVKHLTRFAIVAAADVTPPAPPTGLKAAKGAPGTLTLSWKNPVLDFDHAKVYRSDVKSSLGSLIANDLAAETYADSKGVSGSAYYYTVRAVDPAGNESNNTDQVSGTFEGERTGQGFARNLRKGSKGEDVVLLQQILAAADVYPDKIVSGYFGNLTLAAVVKFQEKYSDEILKPVGLTKGTGFVGPSTRNKLNKLVP